MKKIIITLILFIFIGTTNSQFMRYEDRIRIREAMNISEDLGEQLWNDFSKEPFTLLFVTDTLEYLINHHEVPHEFINTGYDSILKTSVYIRNRVYDKDLLASFPAVNGVNVIVVGTPENTGKSSTEWVISLLHEHFHQYTFNSKNYNIELDSLGLRGDDVSGMWALNYKFPYSENNVIEHYNRLSNSLYDVLNAVSDEDFKQKLDESRRLRENLKSVLSENDYRYMAFQEWQEGIARYTEYKFLEHLDNYNSYRGITDLPDYISYDSLKRKALVTLLNNLRQPKLGEWKRVMFYYTGMAEGLILDRINPIWRKKYLTDKFLLDEYFTDN